MRSSQYNSENRLRLRPCRNGGYAEAYGLEVRGGTDVKAVRYYTRRLPLVNRATELMLEEVEKQNCYVAIVADDDIQGLIVLLP